MIGTFILYTVAKFGKLNVDEKMKRINLQIILTFILIYPLTLFGQEIRGLEKIQKIQTTFNIMPMGNSITKGFTGSPAHFGYREYLYNELVSALPSYTIHFVGEIDWKATSGNQLNTHDYWTEAYQGWETTDIINVINGTEPSPPGKTLGTGNLFPTRVPSDMVLLHIGTNDLEFEPTRTPADIASNVNTILGNIQTQNNSIVVVLARIILNVNDNLGVNGPKGIKSKQYNNNLLTVALNNIKASSNNKLIVVNMQDALNYPDSLQTYSDSISTSDLFYDGETILHPIQSGYNKMTAVWFSAVSGYFNGIPTLIAPVDNAVNVYTPLTLAWGTTQDSGPYTVEVSTDQNFGVTPIYSNSSVSTRYVTLSNSVGLVSHQVYYWRVTDNISSHHSATWKFTVGTPLYVKVFLQGPYNTGSHNMNANLRNLSSFPKTQPYNASLWNYYGLESVLSVPNNVVDWVLVQLRTGLTANTTFAQRTGFLLQDGTVVDLDGTTPINFNVDPSVSFYIVVKHRNHLAVMSNSAVTLSSLSSSSPFTFNNSNTYGTNAMVSLETNVYGMWAGDVNGDTQVDADDRGITWNYRNQTGYLIQDVNLDITVDADDRGITWNNRNLVSNVPN